MRLKSFYAKTMSEAMLMVRHTLGEDAVIVATREENAGSTVRVTAAIEQPDYGDIDVYDYFDNRQDAEDRLTGPAFEIGTVAAPQTSARSWLQYDDENEETAVVEELTDVMLRHGVADEIVDQIISCATVIGEDTAEKALIAAIEHLYSFRPLPQKPTMTAHMMVGPPGCGKTLAVAKLAARSVMAGLRVAVITADTVRAGGIEQLSAFTNILHIDLLKASSAQTLRDALDSARHADQIFIDTPGYNPFVTEDMRDLARLCTAGDIEPVLVMPGGLDADESGEMGRVYATIGVRSMIATRLDIARRFGGLLGAAHHGGLIFADASATHKVADGLIGLSPARLAHFLMPKSSLSSQSSLRSPSHPSSLRKKQTA